MFAPLTAIALSFGLIQEDGLYAGLFMSTRKACPVSFSITAGGIFRLFILRRDVLPVKAKILLVGG
jgi:hypothetical protein